VLARNYHFGRREVDLVVRRDDVIAFVEVKTRAGDGYGAPAEAVTALKRREIETVALQFLVSEGLHDVGVRFDVISIVVDRDTGSVELEHIEDAWRPGGS
jgi:putative endonuclease